MDSTIMFSYSGSIITLISQSVRYSHMWASLRTFAPYTTQSGLTLASLKPFMVEKYAITTPLVLPMMYTITYLIKVIQYSNRP